MENDLEIAIADFAQYPSGRDERDGEFNGARFRTTILAPAVRAALESGSRVIISLSNVMSFGSSFLEEAFGGLVRKEQISRTDLKKVLHIEAGPSQNDRYRDAIYRYIDRA